MFRFTKEEKLCNKKIISDLFEKNESLSAFPVKLLWKLENFDSNFPVQVMFAVPKRNIKKANKRNLIKRRMREAYRLNKSSLYATLNDKGLKIACLMMYQSKEMLDYKEIENKTKLLFERLKSQV